MSAATVSTEVRGHVAIMTLNRPENANVLNLVMAKELLEAVIAVEKNRGVRTVVLTGAGKHFCFGGDLRGMMGEGGAIDAYLRELTSYLHTAISHFVRMDAPVIAAVNGTAAGAGVGLVAMSDYAICAQGAKFALAYTGVGLTPDGSTSFFLPKVIGTKRAMELMLTNRPLSAEQALAWGLVNQVVADAALLNETLAFAQKLALGPVRAFGKTKRLVAASSGALEAHLALESQMIARQGASAEGREGINAFLEKRQADYIGASK